MNELLFTLIVIKFIFFIIIIINPLVKKIIKSIFNLILISMLQNRINLTPTFTLLFNIL